MIEQKSNLPAAAEGHAACLDLVIPFTTPPLTRIALDAATRLAGGLNARLRLIRIQPVPFPLTPEQSPVSLEFMTEQLLHITKGLPVSTPVTTEIRLCREPDQALQEVSGPASVVVLATRRRPWRTRTERMARSLTRHGHRVILLSDAETISPLTQTQSVQAEVVHA